jgi:hypothetical protein
LIRQPLSEPIPNPQCRNHPLRWNGTLRCDAKTDISACCFYEVAGSPIQCSAFPAHLFCPDCAQSNAKVEIGKGKYWLDATFINLELNFYVWTGRVARRLLRKVKFDAFWIRKRLLLMTNSEQQRNLAKYDQPKTSTYLGHNARCFSVSFL